jgi:ankyrin repeat protein
MQDRAKRSNRYKRPDNAHWLLTHGANPNAGDNNGMTPLHHTARQGTPVDVIQDLLDPGGNNRLKDDTARTLLDWAEEKNRNKALALPGSL